jgi:HEAT repeat protein/S1-C subfamily serine protease
MPFLFTCPSCRTTSQVLDELAGTRAKCPTCGVVVPIPALGQPVEGIPTIPPLEDDEPVPRTGSSMGGLVAALLVGLFLLVCCGGGGLVGFFAVREATPRRPNVTVSPAVPTTKSTMKAPERPAPVDDKALYHQLLKSTAWIISDDGRRVAIGTAAVIHREQRLLLTNYHILRTQPRVVVIFPALKPDGKPITKASHYFEAAAKKGLKTRLAASDQVRDLALLQVDELPADVKPLPLAVEGPAAGQRLWAVAASERVVGFGEEDGALWRFEPLTVKRAIAYDHGYRDGQRVKAQAIEMSPGSGDNGFGGPVVNDSGHLVGVLCDFARPGVRVAIEVREAREFVQAHFDRIGMPWAAGGAAPSSPEKPLDLTNNSPNYWLQVLRDANEAQAEKARERLIAMGRAAILDLRKALRDPDPKLRLVAANVLGEMGDNATAAVPDLAKSLTDADTTVRISAARSLGRLGLVAHLALVALITASADSAEGMRSAVEAALLAIGPVVADDVPKLLTLWEEKNAAKRGRYLSVAFGLKPGPSLAGPIVAPLISDADKAIRLRAIRAAEEAGPPAHGAAFGKLMDCAMGGDAEIRKAALAALEKTGPAVAADRPLLESGLSTERSEVRLFCLQRLGGLGAAAATSAPDVARLLRGADGAVRVAAARALGQIGKPAAGVLPDVMLAAREADPEVRAAACDALAKLSREPQIVTMLFDTLSNDDSAPVREATAKALRSLDPLLGPDDVPALRVALRSKAVESRRCAAAELARLGADAVAAADEMLTAARDPDYEVRRHVFAALPVLGEKSKELLPIVLETMKAILQENGQKPGSLPLFRQAAMTFGKLGDPLDALPIWSKGVKTKDRALRKEVVVSLATVGPAARKSAGDLCALLDDADLAEAVSETLLALRGPEVVRALSDVLEDNPSLPAKLAAIRVLAKMGPEAKDAYQALYRTSQRFAGKEVAQAAREALKEVTRK